MHRLGAHRVDSLLTETAIAHAQSGDRFCTACGEPKATPFCIVCGADVDGIPAAIRLFARGRNWGAFFLPGLWAFWHGSPWTAVAWWAFLVVGVFSAFKSQYVPAGLIVAFCIACVLLFRGNRIALERRPYRDLEHVVAVETRWARWGIAAAVLLFIACVALALRVVVNA